MEDKQLQALWTTKEVAHVLGLDRSTVRKFSRLGLIPTVRVGPRTVRFDPVVIQARIAQGGFSASLAASGQQATRTEKTPPAS